MAIELTEQIRVYAKEALEARTNVGTIADMHAIPLNERYNGLIVTVRTTGERYELLYDGDFEALSEAAQDAFLASNGNFALVAKGLSAYEIWLEEGNVGTKQDFLDSLQGDSFNVDAQGLLTGLSTFDAELEGFSYLATDTGNLYIKNSDTSGDWSAPIPFRGPQGQSAYQVWIEAGNTGNVQDYIDSLKGAQGISAYQVAVNNGFAGTEAQWLASLKGTEGDSAYQVWLDAGNEGTVQDYLLAIKGGDGEDGDNGLSAYEVAVANGYADTEAAWLLSLKGAEGDTAYEVWLAAGNTGSVQDYLASLKGTDGVDGTNGIDGTDGTDGLSAYEIAVNNGFVGSVAQWLASLNGTDGEDGTNGTDGTDGTDGLSAYEIAVNNGFVGSVAQWLASLNGTDGEDGTNGTDGTDGLSAYEIAVNNGFVGTEQDFIDSLQGDSFNVDEQGTLANRANYNAELKGFSYLDTTAGNLYIKNSNTSGDWSDPIPFRGPQGQSAYQIAVANGFVGTVSQWLASLQGTDGIDGTNGTDGTDGVDGDDGLSAYQIAVANGFEGTEAEWLESLKAAAITREELEFTSIAFASSIEVAIPANIKHIKRNITLTGNVTSFALTGLKNGDRGTFYVSQDATGGRTITQPEGTYGEFIIDDFPNEITELTFEYNGAFVVWRSAPVVGDGVVNPGGGYVEAGYVESGY